MLLWPAPMRRPRRGAGTVEASARKTKQHRAGRGRGRLSHSHRDDYDHAHPARTVLHGLDPREWRAPQRRVALRHVERELRHLLARKHQSTARPQTSVNCSPANISQLLARKHQSTARPQTSAKRCSHPRQQRFLALAARGRSPPLGLGGERPNPNATRQPASQTLTLARTRRLAGLACAERKDSVCSTHHEPPCPDPGARRGRGRHRQGARVGL